MDSEAIGQAIDEELEKLSLNLSDVSDVDSDDDTESENDFTASYGKLENDLPESVLTYFEASCNRVNTFEQLILEDVDENDTELSHQSHFDSLLNELVHDPEEDLIKLKERIISEIEEHVAHPSEADGSPQDDSNPAQHVNDETECGMHNETKRQLICEWRELEKKLRKEEEQRLAELEAEREHHLNSAREEEEKRKRRLEEFENELREIGNTNLCKDLGEDSYTKESIQLELAKQQEVIKELEQQLEEERRAYEEAQQEERRKSEEQRCEAAIKLQAAFRGVLVRRWSKNELIKRKEEARRRQEEIEERARRREREERMKREWEEERRRAAAEEQRQREELEKRRAEYEKAKEREHHRLEKERKQEEQRRREEEAKRMEDERKRKEGEERRKQMEEGRKRRLEEDERKWKEEKKKKDLESKLMQRERKLEKKDSKGEDGKVVKTNEELDGWEMEERRMREKERRKRMEEHRMEEEKRSILHVEREKKEEERNKEEFASKQMQKEKRLEEKESKKEEGELKKRNRERDGQKMEESRKREEERQKRMEDEKRRLEEEERKNKSGKLVEEKKTKKESKMQEEQRKILAKKESKQEEMKVMRNEKIEGWELEEKTGREVKNYAKRLDDQQCFLKTDNKNTKKSEKGEKEERNEELVPQTYLSQSNNNPNVILAGSRCSSNGHHQICSAVPTDNTVAVMTPALDTRGRQCETANSGQNCDQNSICLPDRTEQKRLAWMMNCTPWSKLSMQNKRKGLTAPHRKKGVRRPSIPSLPPLPVDTVLRSGPWNTLRQVTTVTLEDLPGCSLSTLSECTSLQSLTLRRCGLQTLEGLHQCSELRHIDVQENSITYVDLEGLKNLEVLLLGRNQLTSAPGLDSAVNLTVLQLSHNIISRLSGLGSLKRLQRLSVDHNQLINTKGLSEAFTLLYLDCSYNHLSHMEGLEHCALLNTLDLRGNSLTELPVLKNQVLLRELYLDDNSISSLHGLDSCWLPLLCRLSVAQNNITQLPSLVDLLSLRTLDVSHNCLSELRNICLSLQGCTRLQELNLSDNPLQLENNWRSCVLAANASLIKLNGDLTGASAETSVGSTQLWSFQALCQAHQDQLDSVLQRHIMDISLASSVLDAQLLARNHSAELFRLAEEQRYAHEYGDSSVSETATKEPAASSCLQDVSDGDLTQLLPAEQETQSQPKAHLTGQVHKTHLEHPAADVLAGCTGGCINEPKKFKEEQSGHNRRTITVPRMDLKTMAATVIQRFWRKHRQTSRLSPSEPPAKANGRRSPERRERHFEKSPEPHNKDCAAAVIQAIWRGYALRKRLARALALAQISEGDEAFEEVDVDEFIFDEEAMESDWIALHSDTSSSGLPSYSEQLLLPKPPLLLPELHLSTPVLPSKPKQAWTGSELAAASEQSLSPSSNIRMQSPPSTLGLGALSEKSEKILEEWGISSGSTALLMLKRAQKMKARNQRQRKLLDPAVRLALFRNQSKQPVPVNAQKRPQPKCKDDIKAGRAEVSVENVLSGEPGRLQQHRTYQWLRTQAIQTQRSSATSASDNFLPEIDPDILKGGRVQLVAGARYEESPDSAGRLWSDAYGSCPSQNQHAHVRRHSVGHAKKDVLSPKRVTSAPSRKERISFRDNPVQLSGGWGGGKKRAKVMK